MKKFAKEFREFIAKGDVMSMAVGIIIGGAFTAIVNSLVGDIITPLLGVITGGIDFTYIGKILLFVLGADHGRQLHPGHHRLFTDRPGYFYDDEAF